MRRSDWPGSLRSMMFLGFAVVLAACADPGVLPGDRPSVDGCGEWFNDQAPALAGSTDAVVAAQAAHEWNGETPVCWVTTFQPHCTLWHAWEPGWDWVSEPLPPGDCDPMRASVQLTHRLVDGRLISR